MSDAPFAPGLATAQAVLAIDLGALVDNWRAVAGAGAPAECGAVVKADAYGLGLEPVVRALAGAGCRTFFVANPGEARRTRVALGTAPARIYALNGLTGPEAAQALAACDAHGVVGSREDWELWRAHAPGKPCAAHIDTGMNRLGMSAQEARALAANPHAGLVDLVMSHFVSSEAWDDPLNDAQIAAFDALRPLFPKARASMANSSGVLLPQRPHYDLTRPGYALYGGNPRPGAANPMRSVVRLEAPILRVRHVGAGATVGYNATWTARRDSVLVVIGIGYADGLLRSASGAYGHAGAETRIAGACCPIVGRISMDLTVIDATDAPAAAVRPGALVRLLDEAIGVDDLAARAGTIGYEILTSLGARYHRVYV